MAYCIALWSLGGSAGWCSIAGLLELTVGAVLVTHSSSSSSSVGLHSLPKALPASAQYSSTGADVRAESDEAQYPAVGAPVAVAQLLQQCKQQCSLPRFCLTIPLPSSLSLPPLHCFDCQQAFVSSGNLSRSRE